ncbi:hypothetical protein BpHYR1_041981 [Brachionus plicatilis]|uniref:Uncharacterized protein n=1 Tax=Brachionus plicatilis TaxID=10195 RepID=A0A3M7R3X3_BRAPC|nr:hypothetical protein BpHYR1_041981 [Brachionus plicatilis]
MFECIKDLHNLLILGLIGSNCNLDKYCYDPYNFKNFRNRDRIRIISVTFCGRSFAGLCWRSDI